MKLSLAWIFDHIDADWQKSNPEKIVELFNKTTAEIEGSYHIAHDLTQFFMVNAESQNDLNQTVSIPELKQTISLPTRSVLFTEPAGKWLVKKEGSHFRWATFADFNVEKEGYLPTFTVADIDMTGTWRTQWQATDVIFEVDNKSITHRPDMWGHRGFAREIAAFMKLPFRSSATLLKPIPEIPFHRATSKVTATCPITIDNQDVDGCKQFSGLYFSSVAITASTIHMASRLMNIGARPINALIDLTNYVMNDWSQPVHAYDADKIQSNNIVIRKAHNEEKLHLLGDIELTLTSDDIVIANAQAPMCLAGIKGGKDSGISSATTKIFLEAATFDAGTVRRTAQHHKLRTDSSTRFEKTLNPEQTIEVIKRFAYLVDAWNFKATHAQEIVWLGSERKKHTIQVPHVFLESRIGIMLTEADVVTLLTPLEFTVITNKNSTGECVYDITIPPFRASKDIKIKEDILEEIVRCYGFERIPPIIPKITRLPFNMLATTRARLIKRFFAHTANMMEQQNYSLIDEQFVASLGITVHEVISLVNPISENHHRMIPSLIPGLLKNIKENHNHRDALSFFEWGRVWKGKGSDDIIETKSLAGIVFKKRATVDFYVGKAIITNMITALGLDETKLSWKKSAQYDPWYSPHQTTDILYSDNVIGTAGVADLIILNKLEIDAESSAFLFEIDGNFLATTPPQIHRYKHISKFQDTYVDISLFAPLTLATQLVIDTLRTIDPLIKQVELIDFFEKAEWHDVRALTVRLWLEHNEKTLQKADIDAVWQRATAATAKLGAKARI